MDICGKYLAVLLKDHHAGKDWFARAMDMSIGWLFRPFNRVFAWTGAKYAVTSQVDVIAAYYHYQQHSNFGTPTGGVMPCDGKEHAQCAGTLNAISGVIDWKFAPKWDVYLGLMYTELSMADCRTHFS